METMFAQTDNWLLKFWMSHTLHQCHEYINFILNRKEVAAHYFEFTTRFFSRFSEPQIRMHLKFDVLYFTFRKSQEPDFPRRRGRRRRSGLAKRELNSADSEIYRVTRNDCRGFNNCHTQYTWDRCICIFLFNRTALRVFVVNLTGALYMHHLWFYKHQHDTRVRSKLFVACQRWWFQWRFWFVHSVPGYLREEEEHKPCSIR